MTVGCSRMKTNHSKKQDTHKKRGLENYPKKIENKER